MIDREKVIKGLECCSHLGYCENQCPYFVEFNCIELMSADALELLKEQRPVKPDYDPTTLEWSCGNCGQSFDRCKYKYCPTCGRAVKWDEIIHTTKNEFTKAR